MFVGCWRLSTDHTTELQKGLGLEGFSGLGFRAKGLGLRVLGFTQRLQNPLIKEYTLNLVRGLIII